MLVPVIIFAVLLLTAILLLHELDVKIQYVFAEKDFGQVTIIIFFLWRLLHIEYRVEPVKALKTEGSRDEKRKNPVETIKQLIRAYRENRTVIRRIFRRIHIKELNISVYPATGDACSTGILTGLVWTLIGGIDALLACHARVDKRNIMVTPEYASEKTRADASCIIRMKIVNIIVIVILIKRYIALK